jgi:hypothetical protein
MHVGKPENFFTRMYEEGVLGKLRDKSVRPLWFAACNLSGRSESWLENGEMHTLAHGSWGRCLLCPWDALLKLIAFTLTACLRPSDQDMILCDGAPNVSPNKLISPLPNWCRQGCINYKTLQLQQTMYAEKKRTLSPWHFEGGANVVTCQRLVKGGSIECGAVCQQRIRPSRSVLLPKPRSCYSPSQLNKDTERRLFTWNKRHLSILLVSQCRQAKVIGARSTLVASVNKLVNSGWLSAADETVGYASAVFTQWQYAKMQA